MQKRYVLFMAAALFVAGCATNRVSPDLSRIHVGMPQTEARKLLGHPSAVATARGFGDRVEIYRYTSDRAGHTNDCVVVFYQGKVKEFGPYMGYLKQTYPDAFADAKSH